MKVISVADELLEGMYVPSTDSDRYAAGSDVIANAIAVSPILVDPVGVYRSEAAARPVADRPAVQDRAARRAAGGDRLGGGARRPALLVAAALATYETVVDGIPVSVAIERPEADRAGEAWRCRIRVIRGTGRREQSQVVGVSAEAVLREAIELAATRLGVAGADLLGEASVGIAAPARAARPVRREGWSA
ncbi:hypothetical protein KO481_21220 [Nocardia sp. NEAU-G5]|uniref:Uncharacterized protein n=1 Tax=Nocardia albiluteola TaxID=2842303 RepID=A0ABS6B172_9NOCA|nr:hypothetical protein [Nocardia albiluteola]MBU3064039.1 hypothetical protein [Nocardia albiluteola]